MDEVVLPKVMQTLSQGEESLLSHCSDTDQGIELLPAKLALWPPSAILMIPQTSGEAPVPSQPRMQGPKRNPIEFGELRPAARNEPCVC